MTKGSKPFSKTQLRFRTPISAMPPTRTNLLIGYSALLMLLTFWTIQLLHPGAASPWIFLDNLNLLIHEAGHWLFSPFGQFIYILGGSLNQCLLPSIFLGYFIYHLDWAGSSFGLFWLGDNLINVSYYIGDARAMVLPLLGGDSSGHDWHNILSMLNALTFDTTLATIVRSLGSLCLVASIVILALIILITWSNQPSPKQWGKP
jgi:hypothetical protein